MNKIKLNYLQECDLCVIIYLIIVYYAVLRFAVYGGNEDIYE